MCLSAEVLAEIRDVLTRPKLQRKFPVLRAEAVGTFLGRLSRTAVVINDVPPVADARPKSGVLP